MAKKLIVRKATAKDLDGIVEVLESTKLSEEAWNGNAERVKEDLRKSEANEDYVLLVAEHEGKVVGFVGYVVFPSLWEGSNQGLVGDFFVHADAQSMGVGGTLIAAVVERAEADDLSELHVSTEWENMKAQQFYSRHGFTEKQLLLERHI